MSDNPPPPPPDDGRTPPPPPPPPPPSHPNFGAPSGYAGYTASPMGSVALKRVGAVSKAAMILVAIAGFTGLLTLMVGRGTIDDAETFLDGGMSSDEFLESLAPYLLMSLVQFVAVIASAVLVIVWMFRIADNHRALQRGATWAPIWAVFGWILPPLLYVIPFLMLRELYRASNPDVPVGGEWRSGKVSPMVMIWFLVYSVLPLYLMFTADADAVSNFSGDEEALANQITSNQGWSVISALLAVAGAAAFIAVAREITGRHRRLTGEDQR